MVSVVLFFIQKKELTRFYAIAGELFSFAFQSRRSGSFISYYITIVKEVSKKHSLFIIYFRKNFF